MKLKSIYKIDLPSNGTKGYQVQVKWQGKVHTKYFAASKCGGMTGALLSAVSWRDALELEFNKRRSEGLVRVGSGTTGTGVSGVTLRKGNYIAKWLDINGKAHHRSFSKRKYGAREAFNMACAVRRDKEVELLLG